MLRLNEFSAGFFHEAKPLSLVLPRSGLETTALVGTFDGNPAAVLLSGQHKFMGLPNTRESPWRGVLVAGVRIEVDETTAFDPAYDDSTPGTVLRRGTELCLSASTQRLFRGNLWIVLHSDLPEVAMAVGFRGWQVVIGSGLDQRVLWSVAHPTPQDA